MKPRSGDLPAPHELQVAWAVLCKNPGVRESQKM